MLFNSGLSNIEQEYLQQPKLEAAKKAKSVAVKSPAVGFTYRSYNLSSFH